MDWRAEKETAHGLLHGDRIAWVLGKALIFLTLFRLVIDWIGKEGLPAQFSHIMTDVLVAPWRAALENAGVAAADDAILVDMVAVCGYFLAVSLLSRILRKILG